VTAKGIDDLYELPLSDFTAARNKLAKETGDKSLTKLRKPSAAAWALNQAARTNKGDVARFLHAAANVRASADRAALAELRHTEGDVRRAAQAALGDRSNTHVAEINALLAQAASDEDVADVLREGRLTGDEEANADGFVGMVAAKAPSKAPPKDEVKVARERKARDEARRKWEAADATAKEAEEDAARLEREADDAADKAARLRARAETAKSKADKARKKADDLKP
jgi:hypothetical protein